jgi:hypothetical protein
MNLAGKGRQSSGACASEKRVLLFQLCFHLGLGASLLFGLGGIEGIDTREGAGEDPVFGGPGGEAGRFILAD